MQNHRACSKDSFPENEFCKKEMEQSKLKASGIRK